MDRLTREKRSWLMSRVRSRGNESTEVALAKVFRFFKVTGWRRHQPVFGKPDFIFPKQRLAVFVDGCFWHGCPRCYATPKSNQRFWNEKFTRNRKRDLLVNRKLRRWGWRVLRVWEHDLAPKRHASLVQRIRKKLSNV